MLTSDKACDSASFHNLKYWQAEIPVFLICAIFFLSRSRKDFITKIRHTKLKKQTSNKCFHDIHTALTSDKTKHIFCHSLNASLGKNPVKFKKLPFRSLKWLSKIWYLLVEHQPRPKCYLKSNILSAVSSLRFFDSKIQKCFWMWLWKHSPSSLHTQPRRDRDLRYIGLASQWRL